MLESLAWHVMDATADDWESLEQILPCLRETHGPVEAVVAAGVIARLMVEGLMERRGAGYPFQRLSQTLGDADAAVGNLEGAINSDHVRTPEGSLAFSFTSGTSRTLAENHFAILSLANNHT